MNVELRPSSPRVRIVADQLRRPVPGGIGTYVEGLAVGLRRLETSGISLWASRPPKEDRLANFGFPVVNSVFPTRVLARMWDHGIGGDSPSGVDVIHATSFAIPPTSLPLVVTVHDTAWRQFPDAYPERGRAWHEAGLQRTLKSAAAIVTPSPAAADEIRNAGFAPDRVHVIDEGVDNLAAPDDPAAEALLDSLNVYGHFLLAVGTLEPRKNLPRLLQAYAAAQSSLPESLPLVVVGPVGWGESIEPPPGVIMAGKVEAGVLSALYSHCRALVSVPLVEGYGLPAVEAMAMGAAVISSPVPSTGGAAFEVSPTDVDAIADAIVRVCSDDAIRAELVLKGAARAKQLTWAAVAQQHLDVWSSL